MVRVPKETRRHFWAAVREQILAVRSLVDAGAEWFEGRARGERPEARAAAEEERPAREHGTGQA